MPASTLSGLTSVFGFVESEFDPIVTTGTRRGMRQSESPSSVWVIDHATIEASAGLSLGDVLRLIPGFSVVDVGPSQAEIVPIIPAVPSLHTLFLIDGRSILYDAVSTTDRLGMPVDMLDIDRIEVVYGPASTLYGAGAFSGVINIITRKPLHQGSRSRAAINGGLAWGSNGGADLALHGPRPLGSFFTEHTSGFGTGGIKVGVNGDYAPSFATDLKYQPQQKLGGYIDASLELKKWQLRAQLMAARHNTVFPLGSTGPFVIPADLSLTLNAKRDGLFAAGDNLSLTGWGRYVGMDMSVVFQNSVAQRLIGSIGSGEVLAQYSTPTFFKNQLIAGLQLRAFSVELPEMAERTRFQAFTGLYVEDVFRPIDPLIFTAGVRLETRENRVSPAFSHFTASPRLAAVWLPKPGHSLRLEAANSYRNPSPIENFIDLHDTMGQLLFVSDPNLKPEQLWSFGLGYQGRFNWFRLRTELNVVRYSDPIAPSAVANDSAVIEKNGIPLVPSMDDAIGKLPVFYENHPNVLWFPILLLRMDATPARGLHFAFQGRLHPASVQSFGLLADYTWNRFNFSAQVYYYHQAERRGGLIASRFRVNVEIGVALDSARRWQLVLAGTNLVDVPFYFPTSSTKPRLPNGTHIQERIGPRVWLSLRANFSGL